MRILFIIQWFQPEPTLKGLPLAKELAKLGHHVEVLTGLPNYPIGKYYPGYHFKLLQRETLDGIPITRVPLYPSHDTSKFGRILNYMSYAFSAALIGPWVVKKFDVAYVYHPPATIGIPAFVFRFLRGLRFVYDIQDLWPDSLEATGMFRNKFGLWVVNQWCKIVYRMANKIVVLSPGFKKLLIERGVPDSKIEVVYNWADDTAIMSVDKNAVLAEKLGLSNRFNIMFAGNMGKAQALDAVLHAAKLIKSDYPNIQFVFIGDGLETDNLKKIAKDLNLNNVLFLPRYPLSEIGEIMALADVLLVHLKDDPLFAITIPSKIQSYLAIGRPILVGVRGDAANLVLNAHAGLVCTPEDPLSIAEKVKQFAQMSQKELYEMGANGRKYYQKELSLPIGAKRLEGVFESVARNSEKYDRKGVEMEPVGYENKTEIKSGQWKESASLIAGAIPNSIISKLGVKFNTIFYKSIAENECSCAFLAHSPSGKSLGVIIGTLDRPFVYKVAVKNNMFRLILGANFRIVRPAVIKWIIKGILSKFSGKKMEETPNRPLAELIVIAVQPEARGTGVAANLVAMMEKWMKSKGLKGPYMILTEKSNGRSNKFYAKIGSHFVGTTLHHGREINEWRKEITVINKDG
jgi:glycosyltransferase involved in cell wall biosynthesis/GNAT superfamily N-acetyltransferase